MRLRQGVALLVLGSTMLAAPALAVTGLESDIPRPAPDGTGDELRPWDAEAHNLAGHAYRKLGDYERALTLYDQALRLNPHHRGALEYLGEAYLELDRPAPLGCQRL